MPSTISNGLCNLADVKAALRITDTTDDDRLNLSVDAASRQIERSCGRRFYQDSTATARLFVASTPFMVEVDDFWTTTGLVLETMPYGNDAMGTVVWSAGPPADYQLEPLNGLLEGHPWPFTRIRAVRSLTFPVFGGIAYPVPYVQALIRVTAKWGWPAVPSDVRKAAIVQATALFKSDDVPFGATPFGETGIVRLRESLHPTAAALISSYQETTVKCA